MPIDNSHNAEYLSQIDDRAWQVPNFDIHVRRERNSKYCVVIPVINEGDRIQSQLRRMNDLGVTTKFDVLIADGGSTDQSLELNFLEEVNVKSLITKRDSGKLSAQLRCGYAVALLDGYEGIITIDGNDKDSVESIESFATALDSGVDYAQASRFIKGGKGERTPPLRLAAVRLIHSPFLSLVAGRYFSDTTQGFRAYSRRYLMDERVVPFRNVFQEYELLAYLTVRASQLGYETCEIPTTRSYPENSKTPTKINSLVAHADLIKVLFKTALGNYHPPTHNPATSQIGKQ